MHVIPSDGKIIPNSLFWVDHKQAMEKCSGLDKEVKRLHNKILEVNKSRTKDAQQCLDQAKGKVEKLSKEISRLTVEIQTSQRSVLGHI